MTQKTYAEIQAEIDALSAQQVEAKTRAVIEIKAQMAMMSIKASELDPVSKRRGRPPTSKLALVATVS